MLLMSHFFLLIPPKHWQRCYSISMVGEQADESCILPDHFSIPSQIFNFGRFCFMKISDFVLYKLK
jgi:hypothetical protein